MSTLRLGKSEGGMKKKTKIRGNILNTMPAQKILALQLAGSDYEKRKPLSSSPVMQILPRKFKCLRFFFQECI